MFSSVLSGGYKEGDLVDLDDMFPSDRLPSITFAEYGYEDDSDLEDENDEDSQNEVTRSVSFPFAENTVTVSLEDSLTLLEHGCRLIILRDFVQHFPVPISATSSDTNTSSATMRSSPGHARKGHVIVITDTAYTT